MSATQPGSTSRDDDGPSARDEYEAGYQHGAAFARLTIAITAVSDAIAFIVGTDAEHRLKDVVSALVAERDRLRDA
jgi:hypothetical protein